MFVENTYHQGFQGSDLLQIDVRRLRTRHPKVASHGQLSTKSMTVGGAIRMADKDGSGSRSNRTYSPRVSAHRAISRQTGEETQERQPPAADGVASEQ